MSAADYVVGAILLMSFVFSVLAIVESIKTGKIVKETNKILEKSIKETEKFNKEFAKGLKKEDHA